MVSSTQHEKSNRLRTVIFSSCFLIILFIFSVNQGLAVTWYVSSLGNGSGSGLKGDPWIGFNQIKWDKIESGDTLTGENNIFKESLIIHKSGTKEKPILIKNMELAQQSGHAISGIDGTSYITFDHLNIHDVAGIGIILRDCNGLTIRNCMFKNNGRKKNRYGHIRIVQKGNSPISDIIIRGNTFTNNDTWGKYCENFYVIHVKERVNNIIFSENTVIGGYSAFRILGKENPIGTKNLSPTGVVVKHNTMSGQHHCAIMTGSGVDGTLGDPSSISYNHVINNGRVSGEKPSQSVNALQLNWVRNVLIEGNLIQTVRTTKPDGNGIILDDCWRNPEYISSGCTVRYNWIEDCSLGSGISVFWAKNNKIHHNIISNTEVGIRNSSSVSSGNEYYNNLISDTFDAAILLSDRKHKTGTPRSIWKNNIIYNCKYAFKIENGSVAPEESFNCIYNSSHNDLVQHLSDIDRSPLINGNSSLRLINSSPCLNKGTRLSANIPAINPKSKWPEGIIIETPSGKHMGPWSRGVEE
jgi:hypothetical protein